MPDKIPVTVLKQKVFHDGKSTVVLKPGDGEVEERFVPGLVADKVIVDPDDATASQFDGNSEEIGALRDRIAELETENDDLRKQLADTQKIASIKGEVVEGGAPLSLGTKIADFTAPLLDEHGNPVWLPEGDLSDPPQPLNLTPDERARLPQLAQLDHDNDGQPGGSELYVPPALTGKNKAELLAIAADEDVTIPEGATNAAIVEAIEAARDAYDQGEAPPA